MNKLDVFEKLESNVRVYSRSFPAKFVKAYGEFLFTESNEKYIDFFCGAGALNYGHNHPVLKQRLLEYIANDGITHSLDMATKSKEQFICTMQEYILKPRKMNYKLQFTGPTGANAVEAALKLARKVTGRHQIVTFMNGYHGLSMGALAVTGNLALRKAAGLELDAVTFLPFADNTAKIDSLSLLEYGISNPGSGIEKPAAVILETIQCEGGIHVADIHWLNRLAEICKKNHICLIIDDIQVGCGRTGKFFSFEEMEIQPDIIILSKSLSGYGLPFSLLLLKEHLDHWAPGEHTGTFRGNNLAFVTADAAIKEFWCNDSLSQMISKNHQIASRYLTEICNQFRLPALRGRGFVLGIEMPDTKSAAYTAKVCFENKLIIELCGPERTVLKFMPPLNIREKYLTEGLDILRKAIECTIKNRHDTSK